MRRRERGLALISSLLLLLIITLLALSMFRSFGVQEKIAGNLREKDRALHAAESAQQYAEWWLLQPAAITGGTVNCGAGFLNGTLGQGQICSLATALTPAQVSLLVPWTSGVFFQPSGMSIAGPGPNGDPPYFAVPAFYIVDVGPAADAQGEAYRIDAYGYGGAASTVAVVESVYEVQQGVLNRGGL
ncbi:MAG: pilus assembly protein PilX [Gammaproteobacteria bacterium]|nr:pilus assembly protein PilX [Gammaproteobacteria bacterium]